MAASPAIIRRPRRTPGSEIERKLEGMITGINHGKITLVLQDGMIIQINREESILLSVDSPSTKADWSYQ